MSKNTAKAQRARLLDALTRGPVDTQYASRKLDIIHPPRRVFELRREGWHIVTTWVWRITEAGERHRVGLYVLEGAQ
ncbi:helix-turn-helix domain-containing protein [Ralstonia solanacearum]|uniref:Helix-turn-helix domain-containing protein n=1 Tax=Ralstonia solanacearum TaxID=305 RepID=A0AAW5ZJP3_RALSL|nr:helix-turn-helix domain-containing protein [Ralstonia solanacearum]MDB0569813.1 helix-turn-helix domain-containing protein [Ralstonia solanacearum]